MRALVANASLFSAPVFALIVVVGLASIALLTTPVLVGGLAAVGVLALAFSDYSRKPSFRVRRSAAPSLHRTPASPAVIANLDWTYTSRAA